MIPAGIPVQLSNPSETPVEWIQFRVETPATLCACGEDCSGVAMELLASQTLENSFLPSAVVSLGRQRLDPASEIPTPAPDTVQLAGTVDDDGTMLRRNNGSLRNDGTVAIDVFVATVTSQDPADPAQ